MLRSSNFMETSTGESEQDANSALTELDKGLRSGKVGEQCEAIVRFPRLFEKYPFPILINASMMKLADIFRIGNNFIRLCVLRVCQQSEKHLDKVSNVDECVRRIYSVFHSNDPIGRALTLRTLGALACIIPEQVQVHHSIRTSLDSHDNVEVEAAIHTARQFAAQSKTFAISMCNKIANMIQGQATPANMKLQLIPTLQYMHHDTNTAAMVRSLCSDLLPQYPAHDFLLTILHTMTKLASATLVDIPPQVRLLLQYIETDPRKAVKLKCLEYLLEMAQLGPQLWPSGAVDDFLNVVLIMTSPRLLDCALQVIEVLAVSPQLCHEQHESGSKLRLLCEKICGSQHLTLVARAIHILTQIICYCYQEGIQITGTEDSVSSLETLIMLLTFDDDTHQPQLKVALKCAVRLSEVDQKHSQQFVGLLASRLDCVTNGCTMFICEALGAIAGIQPETLLPHLPILLERLRELSMDSSSLMSEPQRATVVVLLATLVFQSLTGYRWNEETASVMRSAATARDLWANYRIARAAVRYGHHDMAAFVFDKLTEQVSYEHWHFWLVCLREMSVAEATLMGLPIGAIPAAQPSNTNIVVRLDRSILHYNKAIAALKAAGTPAHNLQFQAEYMHIRCEFLQCLLLLVHTCNILCIVPPPAIAATIAQSTRDDLQRHGYVTNQMRKCVKEFKTCGEMYFRLYQTAFDADGATLEHLLILQQMCILLEQCVESVCVSSYSTRPGMQFDLTSTVKLESRQLLTGCQNAARICRTIADENLGLTITHKHVDLLKSMVEVFIDAPLPVPRFFYQVRQSTTLKLAITPQPRVLGEFISVQAGSQLTVKIEGVVQHGSKPGLYRRVAGVSIGVTSQLQQNAKIKEIETKNCEVNTTLMQTVTPHKDFFAAQFLLAFPRGGLYVLTIEASVIDEDGNTWHTGPKSTLTVKVPEEPKLQPIQMPGMVSNANLIPMTEDTLCIRKK